MRFYRSDSITLIFLPHVDSGHGLTRTPNQLWTKSYVQTDFCPFTPSYMDKLVMCGWWIPKNVSWNKITFIYVDT